MRIRGFAIAGGIAAVAASLVGSSGPAMAEFVWEGGKPRQEAAPPPVVPAPAAPVAPIAPVAPPSSPLPPVAQPSIPRAAPPITSESLPPVQTRGVPEPRVDTSYPSAPKPTGAGFGRDVPLESAVRMLAPRGTRVRLEKGVDRKAYLSWDSAPGTAWQLTLAEALRSAGLEFRQDRANIVVRPLQIDPAERAALAVGSAQAPADSTSPYRGAAPVPAVPLPDQAPPPVAVGGGVWRAEAGTTLRKVLEGWARQAGWTVAWQSDRDYPLLAPASIEGDFERAVVLLFGGFADADPPVRARMHRGNRVVVVMTQADTLNTEY